MSLGAIVVLVVEDDATHGKVVQRKLEAYGHEAVVAPSSKEAVLILEDASRRHPDVVLMDVVLGKECGLSVIAGLASRSKAPIVIMTGHFDDDIRQSALLLGAKAVVGKPLDFEALDRLVRKLAAK